MSNIAKTPLCPQCGEPARHVRATAVVRFALDVNGNHIPHRVSAVSMPEGERTYECGGHHLWKANGNVVVL